MSKETEGWRLKADTADLVWRGDGLYEAGRRCDIGDALALGTLSWIGSWGGRQAAVLEHSTHTEGHLTLVTCGGVHTYRLYGPGVPDGRGHDENALYLGMRRQEIADSGRDLLAERLKKQPLSLASVAGILPPLTDGAFCFLSGLGAWCGLLVTLDGTVYPQSAAPWGQLAALYSPLELDARLGQLTPEMTLLEGCLPVISCRYGQGDERLHTLMFVESGDSGREPLLWLRAQWHGPQGVRRENCFAIGASRRPVKKQIPPALYWDAFIETATFWQGNVPWAKAMRLPEAELGTAVRACLNAQALTFAGDHPRYGHRVYGHDIHDWFPPTALTAIEALMLYGQQDRARRIAEQVLSYAVGPSGRFIYRQGEAEVFGASGTEYGQWLWLIHRYLGLLGGESWLAGYRDKLECMGDFLLANLAPCDVVPGAMLVRMCAEADTNGRIYDYTQNSLWAVRGLYALAALASPEAGVRYRHAAQQLLSDVKRAIVELRIPSRFGPVPPFQMQYREIPLNLGPCRDTYRPLDDAAFTAYLCQSDARERFDGQQDYFENVYANYRYYLEMVSSGLLEVEEEQAIVHLRGALGGELLGMSRFLNRIDDWPAFHWARFLLETDRLDAFLLLLYAHAEHHGIRHLAAYYEQPGWDGAIYAPDCVPALLLTPLMVAWVLVFEPVRERGLYLLRGVPAHWYEQDIGAPCLMCSHGEVGIQATRVGEETQLDIRLPPMPPDFPVYVDVRRFEQVCVIQGDAQIAEIQGSRIRLKAGLSQVSLVVKGR